MLYMRENMQYLSIDFLKELKLESIYKNVTKICYMWLYLSEKVCDFLKPQGIELRDSVGYCFWIVKIQWHGIFWVNQSII
jgi:hypothetical protein